MAYWKDKQAESAGSLANSHYAHFYTSYFNIGREEYCGRTVLDVGCGPRGSLEWADNAAERVGLDPLVDRYRTLRIECHRMRYVCAPSERIPFPNDYFDFVTCFNCLDHVDNPAKSLSEITRVLKPRGTFLLIVEINHAPTPTEPHNLSENLINRLSRNFTVVSGRLTRLRKDHDIYQSLLDGIPHKRGQNATPAIISARMTKK